jgi:hypothetical protein
VLLRFLYANKFQLTKALHVLIVSIVAIFESSLLACLTVEPNSVEGSLRDIGTIAL